MDGELLYKVLNKKETRVRYLEFDFFRWCLYYFPGSFHYPKTAPFHKDWCKIVATDNNIYLEGFRECAKTMIVGLLYDLWCIVYKKRRFICCFSYEGKTANDYLFKISVQLQTNYRLINDYGQLFYGDNSEKKSQKKTVSEFITENDIKVKAFSMGMSMRGQVFMSKDGLLRPDSLLLDDIDVINSVGNKTTIDKNFRFLEDEVFGGLADYCQIRILGNVIKEDGINPRLKDKFKDNKKRHIKSQSIYDKKGEIVWSRYTETDKEALEYNKDIKDVKKYKISLESKKRDLGPISFNQNYLLVPYINGQQIISRDMIRYDKECVSYGFDYIQIGVDPAISEKQGSDRFAITVTGFDGPKRYVLQCVKLEGQEKNIKRASKVVKGLYDKWNADRVAVETVAYQAVLKTIFKDMGMAVDEIKTSRDKVTRLLEYQSMFEDGLIYFNPDLTSDLVEELLVFPNGEYDDLMDSMLFSFHGRVNKFFLSSI